jgi:hypothetical protein
MKPASLSNVPGLQRIAAYPQTKLPMALIVRLAVALPRWQTLKRYTHLTPQHVLERLDARPQRLQEARPEPAQP